MHKLEGMIGLCVKAGKAVFGGEQCESRVRCGRLPLVILAEDASDNTKKRMQDKCRTYSVPLISFGTVESLARMTGKRRVSVLGIGDRGFAAAILKIYGGGYSG